MFCSSGLFILFCLSCLVFETAFFCVCSLGCPGISPVDQADLSPREICQPLLELKAYTAITQLFLMVLGGPVKGSQPTGWESLMYNHLLLLDHINMLTFKRLVCL